MDIASHIEPLRNRFDKLEKREKHTVIGGSVALLVMLFYLAVWDPVFSTLEAEKQRYQSQRQLLVWMNDTASEISKLQAAGGSSASRFRNQSVSSLVDRSAITTGVKPFIKKQESDTSGVKIQLEQADFDRLIVWINDLQQKYAIQASKINIEPQQQAGTVNARVTLERDDS